MKALTLHQPWATLVALGLKKFETRSWYTDYRGDLAIHSAKTKRWPHLMSNPVFAEPLANHGIMSFDDLPFGEILCIVTLGKVQSTEYVKRTTELGQLELAYGDWSSGRWAWMLLNRRRLDPTIPARGHQKLWNLDRDMALEATGFIEGEWKS